MKIIHVALIALVSFILAGCPSVPVKDEGSVIRTETKVDGTVVTTKNLSDYGAHAEAASQPIFEMTCPPTGCVMSSLKVRGNGESKIGVPPAPPKSTTAALIDGFFGLANNIIGQTPWVAGTRVLTKAFEAASGKTITTVTTNTDNSNRSTNSDSSNRSTTTTTTTTNTTDNSVNNSNNRNCQTGNGASGGTGTTTGGAGGQSGPATC